MQRRGLQRVTVLLFFCAAVISFFAFKSLNAETVWENTHNAFLATALAPRDAELRFDIGNYYFGGSAYDTEKAERYFREALALDSDLQGPHYQLARI